jgi:hypothetical protein
LNNKFKAKTNAIFLVFILIAGTITAIFSALFMVGASAQAQPYSEIDNRYNIYQPTAGYGMDNNYKKSYGHDNYESTEYPFYKLSYKPEYQSYSEKDNYKSSKDSNSVSINKLKEYVSY